MAEKLKGFRVVDDPVVKDLYANKLIGTMSDGNTLGITLGVLRYLPERTEGDPPKKVVPEVHVSIRLILSPSAAVELVNNVSGLLKNMQDAANRPAEQKKKN